MNDENEQDFESSYYGYWRNLEGKMEAVGTFIRNKRVVPRPPFSMTEPPPKPSDAEEETESPSYLELEDAAFHNLSQADRRIARLAMRDGKSNGQIAEIMGVSRPRISQRLREIADKNECVKMWWRRKKKINQHA